jgi:Protein of unknown function (DUF1566)
MKGIAFTSARLLVVAIAWLALTKTADANAPAGRYTISAGTVYDTKTKLTWQQSVPTTTYVWADAKAYCSSAAVGAALGGTGWRLPTIKELQSLIDYTQSSAIDQTAFPGTPAGGLFWSSTPSADTPTSAWAIVNGKAFAYDMATTAYARCVR